MFARQLLSRAARSNTKSLTRSTRNIQQTQTQQRSFHLSSPSLSAGIVQHRNTPDNNPDLKWDFTPENYKKIEFWLSRYPANYKASGVMPLLTLAQEQNDNWLPIAAMNKIAELLDVPRIRVYETASFYSMYNREKIGKYHIQLCGTTPCMLCGSEAIGKAIEQHLGIHIGETTNDGMFTLTEVECLGACVNAPMIQVNNHQFYENLTPASVVKVVDGLRAGGFPAVKVGPQTSQRVAEGPQGKTSLFDEPKPICRDLDAAFEAYKVEQEKTKAAAAAAAAAAPKKA